MKRSCPETPALNSSQHVRSVRIFRTWIDFVRHIWTQCTNSPLTPAPTPTASTMALTLAIDAQNPRAPPLSIAATFLAPTSAVTTTTITPDANRNVRVGPSAITTTTITATTTITTTTTTTTKTTTNINITSTSTTCDADSILTCPRCDRTFTSHIGLMGHLRIHHTATDAPASGGAAYTSPHPPLLFTLSTQIHLPHGHVRSHAYPQQRNSLKYRHTLHI
ncbi:hypothetical protein SprV_0602158100 [Sparganum proliferum]